MRLREMRAEDVPQVAALEREIFSDPWSEQGFLDSLALEETVFLVLEAPEPAEVPEGASEGEAPEPAEVPEGASEGEAPEPAEVSEESIEKEIPEKILGYIGMYVSFEEGEIMNVAAAPWTRGCGVGSRLMDGILSRGADRGVTRFVLEVRVSNSPAIRLYKKYGFVPAGVRKGFYAHPREDAYIMVLSQGNSGRCVD